MKKTMRLLMALAVVGVLTTSTIANKVYADDGIAHEEQVEGEPTDETLSEEAIPSVDVSNKTAGLVVSSLTSNQEVGASANYQIYFTLAGAGEVYNNVLLQIQLPQEIDQKDVSFHQDLNELTMRGIVPTYDAVTKILTYNFGHMEGGFESSAIVKISTRNGAALNDVSLNLVSSVYEDGVKLVEDSAQITMQSQQNASVSNKYLGLFENGEITPISSLNQDKDGVFGIGVSVNRFTVGSLELDTSSNVIVKHTLPNGLTYVSDDSGITPTSEGNTYTWIFPVEGNWDETYYFVKNFNLVVHVDPNQEYFSKVESVTEANFVYADASTKNVSVIATTMIVPDESTELEQYEDGSSYTSVFSGPGDNVGGVGWINNDNITVNDSAQLGWRMYLTSLTATSPTFGLNSYDAFFNPDPNLNITQFYSGDYYFRPSSTYANGQLMPMDKEIKFSFSVRYTDSSEWVHLVETLSVSTMYTASQLGIDPNRKVETVWLHLHNGSENIFTDKVEEYGPDWMKLPAGLTTTNLSFFTTIDEGYVGSIESTAGLAYSGWTGDGYLTHRKSQYVPTDLRDANNYSELQAAFESRLSPKTAQVVKEPEGISRYVKANAYLVNSENNLVVSGKNQLNFDIINDAASLNPMKGPFVAYALVDNDIELVDIDSALGGQVRIIDSNYKNQGVSLVELKYNAQILSMNKITRIRVPVTIKEDAQYQLKIALFGYLNEDFEVASTTNNDGSITSKQADTEDFDRDGDLLEMIFGTVNRYTYKNAYEYYAQTLVGTDTKEQTAVIGAEDNSLDLDLTISSVKNNPIQNLVLINVLPSVDDTYVLNDEARMSKFDMNLSGPIVLPVGYESYFDVYYSVSKEPKVDGVLDVFTDDDLKKLDAPGIVVDEAWLSFDEINDLSSIRSFKIVMKDNVPAIRTNSITFQLPLIAPANDLTSDTPLVDRVAYSTYAVGINNASVIETKEFTIVFDTEIKELPTTPEKPGLPSIPEEPSKPAESKTPATGIEADVTMLTLSLIGSMLCIALYLANRRKTQR